MASQSFNFLDLSDVTDEECSQLLTILDISDTIAPLNNVAVSVEEEEAHEDEDDSRGSYFSEEESSTMTQTCVDTYLNEEFYTKDEQINEEALQVSPEEALIAEPVQECPDEGYTVDGPHYYMPVPEYSMPSHMGCVNTQPIHGAAPLYIPSNPAHSPNALPNSHSLYPLTQPPPAPQAPPHMVQPTFYVENCQITLSPYGQPPGNNALYQNPPHGQPSCPGQVYSSYLMNDQPMPMHMKLPSDKSNYMQSKLHDSGRGHYRGRGTNRRRRDDHERSNSISSDHSSYSDSGGKSVYKDNSSSSHYASTYVPMQYMAYQMNPLTRTAQGVPLIQSHQYMPNYPAQHTSHYVPYSQPMPVVSQPLESYSQSSVPISQPCEDNLSLQDQQVQCVATHSTYIVTTKVSSTPTNTDSLDTASACSACPTSSSEVTQSLETSNTTITSPKILSSSQTSRIESNTSSHLSLKTNDSSRNLLINGSTSPDMPLSPALQESEDISNSSVSDKLSKDALQNHRVPSLSPTIHSSDQNNKVDSPSTSGTQLPNLVKCLANTEITRSTSEIINSDTSKSQSPVDVKLMSTEEKPIVPWKSADPIIENKNLVNKISNTKKFSIIETDHHDLNENESGITFGEINEIPNNQFEASPLTVNKESSPMLNSGSTINTTNTINKSTVESITCKPSSKSKSSARRSVDSSISRDSKKAAIPLNPPEKSRKSDGFLQSLPQQEVVPPPQMETAWGSQKKSWSQLFKPSDEIQNKQIAYVTPFKEADEMASSLASSDGTKSDSDDISKRKIGGLLSKHIQDYRPVFLHQRGLINKNYWCYVNAPLQALLYCPSFFQLMQALFKEAGNGSANIATPFINGFVDFIQEFSIMPKASKISRKDKNSSPIKEAEVVSGSAFEPMCVYKVLINNEKNPFIEGRQQDAEEMLSCVLNGLHDEMVESLKLMGGSAANSAPQQAKPEIQTTDNENADEWKVQGPKKKSCITRTAHFHQSPISEIFWGQLRSVLQQAGGNTTANLQPFNTLPLDIQSPKVDSIKDALSQLVAREEISGMTCPKTNQEVTATTQVMLEDLPRVLILQLKRFIYDKDGGLQKVTKRIQFPIDLEITKDLLSVNSRGKFSPSQRKYKLFAIVNHEGKEATKGHYVSDIFHPGHSRWLRCDDSNIVAIGEDVVLKHDPPRVPYLLFYRRCDSISHPTTATNTTNGKSRT